MTALTKGVEVDAGDIVAPEASAGSPFVIEDLVHELPHGHRHRARQDGVPVLLTVIDPALWADPHVCAALVRDLQIAAACSHRSLLPIHGSRRSASSFIVVEADPGGTTVREFARHRAARGKPLDHDSVYTLVAHVCNGLDALHPHLVHAYVNADTVFVSATGRVFLASCGVGPFIPRAPGFARFHRAGRLPNLAPELLYSPPQPTPGTDVFGAATLFLELLTGLPLAHAGQPIDELGLVGPPELVLCLERATAPSPTARPPDMGTFKAELSDAMRSGPIERGDPLAPGSKPHPGLPPHPGAAPAPPWGPPAYGGGRPTPYPYAPFHEATPPPAPLPPPRPPVAAPLPGSDRHPTPLELELEELDRATRRVSQLVDEQDAAVLTSTVAAVFDPTAADVDEPLPPEGTTTGSSLLRLRLDAFDDAAARISTLDGEHTTEAAAGPSRSGTYFGSMYEAAPDRPDTQAAPRELSEAAVAESDQRPQWFIVRRGERIGPLSMYDLGQRVRDGELKLDDVLQHRVSGNETTAGKHEALRKAFRTRQERETLQAFARAGKPPVPVPPDGAWGAPRAQPRHPLRSPDPVHEPRSFPIVWIVVAAVAVLGVVGFLLFR